MTPTTTDFIEEKKYWYRRRISQGHGSTPFSQQELEDSYGEDIAQALTKGAEIERAEFLQVVSDNAEDYIAREKRGNPLPTLEEGAVRGFVNYLKENTTILTTPNNK